MEKKPDLSGVVIGALVGVAVVGYLVVQAVAWWDDNAEMVWDLIGSMALVLVLAMAIAAVVIGGAWATWHVWRERRLEAIAVEQAAKVEAVAAEHEARQALAASRSIQVEGYFLDAGHSLTSEELSALGLLIFLHDHYKRVSKRAKGKRGMVWRAEVPMKQLAERWATASGRPLRGGWRLLDLLEGRGAFSRIALGNGKTARRLAYPDLRAAVEAVFGPAAPIDWEAGRREVGRTPFRSPDDGEPETVFPAA